MGLVQLSQDKRFVGPVERYRNSTALVAILDAEFRQRTLEQWEAHFEDQPIIWSPMREMSEAVADRQARAMGYFETVDHPRLGRFETVGPPFQLSESSLVANRPAPELGAHAEAVLREAGLGEDEISAALSTRTAGPASEG
jgi:crotonobetainyl-CoA:carnitine CoA-transferase CaiB-like acyl-CoA transferase